MVQVAALGVMAITIGDVIILVVASVAIIAILATIYKGSCYVYTNRYEIFHKVNAIIGIPQQFGRLLVVVGTTSVAMGLAKLRLAMANDGKLTNSKEREDFFAYVSKEGKEPQTHFSHTYPTKGVPNSIFAPNGPFIGRGNGGNGKKPQKSLWEIVCEEAQRIKSIIRTMPNTGSPLSNVLNVFK